MKLKNSTDFPDRFLRRMVAWCCRAMELSPSAVSGVRFGNTAGTYHGRGNRENHE
jgi:hypothetical protein